MSLEADLATDAVKEQRWSSRMRIFSPSTMPILGKSREAGGDAATLRRTYAGRCYEKLKYVPRVYLRRERRGLVARISIALPCAIKIM